MHDTTSTIVRCTSKLASAGGLQAKVLQTQAAQCQGCCSLGVELLLKHCQDIRQASHDGLQAGPDGVDTRRRGTSAREY